MSTGTAERQRRGALVASSVFVVLLVTAVIWPRPVLWINDLTVQAELSISTVSFLGREAPSWDVVYWGIVGFAVIALFHGRLDDAAQTWGVVRQELAGVRSRAAMLRRSANPTAVLFGTVVLSAFCFVVWLKLDGPLLAQVSRIGSERIHDYVRLSNRLGGGGNPVMVVGFFVLTGLALRRPHWTQLGFAMAVAAGCAGALAGILKPLVARSRPDLWLGPFSRMWGGESSFPSGHTISAFAFVGAVVAGSRSWALRVTVILAATSIATTRVIALRHWPSDVLFSAIVGFAIGFVAGRLLVRHEVESEGVPEARKPASE